MEYIYYSMPDMTSVHTWLMTSDATSPMPDVTH